MKTINLDKSRVALIILDGRPYVKLPAGYHLSDALQEIDATHDECGCSFNFEGLEMLTEKELIKLEKLFWKAVKSL